MISFLDGPAAGTVLHLERTPKLLRVVVSPTDTIDALDQISDTPAPHERIFAYMRIGKPGFCFIDYVEGGRRRGSSGAMAEYRLVVDQPIDAIMRETKCWQEWCMATGPGLFREASA